MGSGYYGGFGNNTEGAHSLNSQSIGSPKNRVDYNTAGSKSVKKVNSISSTHNAHTIPAHGKANSVSQNYKDGKLSSERYYNSSGNAYLDIDYTNHGNAKLHPHVPHEHKIHFDKNGKLIRETEPKGGLNK